MFLYSSVQLRLLLYFFGVRKRNFIEYELTFLDYSRVIAINTDFKIVSSENDRSEILKLRLIYVTLIFRSKFYE